MSAVLERIEQTREALLGALASRDWETITELDLSCRVCVEDVLAEASTNEQVLRTSLEELLDVYRQLIDVASGERQTIVDEMTQIRQAKNAAKVYHLFS
ncbi:MULTISPECIES: flagellar assembly protein FliT [Pseudomonas]|jgi:flagellar protein FliT|uniref:Flagellar protein FliT n=2 Tax=Pseudomonas TaxID=286 RepID=A0A9X8HHH3_PSEPU|nr:MULTISPECIES: flagellar assembly protein FliT [Pseudomonas]KIU51338.1 flagellar assembly protein FliT [Pseudomonas putida]KTC17365.1 flagellar assembly protein FliT [Pseudomonas putida]MBG8561573.1 flagellar protein FliT [Pseudomonas qingdaonensis]MCO7506719.1 flagellar protein FliT [Pseudomonas sp. VE 267-6A]MCO7531537.1 flagellar protein FliT [Pseudomonas sp. 2]